MVQSNYYFRDSCRMCDSNSLTKAVSLTPTPPGNDFLTKEELGRNEPVYPLDLYFCEECHHVQLGHVVDPKILYQKNYSYVSSTSAHFVNHLRNYVEDMVERFDLSFNDLVVDIGSNDGTFLNLLRSLKDIKLFGMDPSSKKFLSNYKKNITVITDFFSKKKLLEKISNHEAKEKFNIITSFAMFYDIEDPNSFCKDICELLNPNGIWVVEFSYLPLLLKNLTYDQICHEHVTYYSLTTFSKILNQNGMKVIDLSFNEINGGSIEVICAKKNSNFKPKSIVEKTLSVEAAININIFDLFQKRVDNVKKTLIEFLKNIPSKDIMGYGASTKGNIVLNHLNLSEKNLKYICDANPFKFNRYTPGSNIKIISKNYFYKSYSYCTVGARASL